MKECFDYQTSPRLGMTFNTYIKEKNNFLFIYYYHFFRENWSLRKKPFIHQDENKGKEKGWAHQWQTQNHLTCEPQTHLII